MTSSDRVFRSPPEPSDAPRKRVAIPNMRRRACSVPGTRRERRRSSGVPAAVDCALARRSIPECFSSIACFLLCERTFRAHGNRSVIPFKATTPLKGGPLLRRSASSRSPRAEAGLHSCAIRRGSVGFRCPLPAARSGPFPLIDCVAVVYPLFQVCLAFCPMGLRLSCYAMGERGVEVEMHTGCKGAAGVRLGSSGLLSQGPSGIGLKE
ncbi:hypothetical protein SKAU_G00160110 [Synaphobranchus kaupii]|uniref:Uncharacterized protein n=1 Tax=Synaphobranchus kaupii TaxID=118154 RepID=A0A9Q1FIG7_SYNKA|nr:hypothetical protein SKAU_G00160110 [Synaphobranchus kaupii]